MIAGARQRDLALEQAVPAPRARGALGAAFRVERRKLFSQLATRVAALVCVAGPIAFGAILRIQSGVPGDTLFGVWVHSSGYAVCLVILSFAGQWGFPLLAGAIAGDLFAGEDRNGTWKTLLTRSVKRREIFAGKALAGAAVTAALVALAAMSSLASGLLLRGAQPLVGLGGSVIGSWECLALVLASWLLCMLPVLAYASLALLLSVAGRNGIAGVLGPLLAALLMQLLGLVGNGTWVHMLLLPSTLDAWHGLFTAGVYVGPIMIGACVSTLWIAACLAGAWAILKRRDFAGAGTARRSGWAPAARAVAAMAVLVFALAAGTALGPTRVTVARVEATIAPVFNRLALLQQRELGRPVQAGEELQDRTRCARHSGAADGPGNDWTCTITVYTASPGALPYAALPVTYDVSVESDGCFKAQAPPSFVGEQTMTGAGGGSIVNPLFTLYGCIDITTGGARPAAAPARGAARAGAAHHRSARELEQLRAAERAAGPAVLREIQQAEEREGRRAGVPSEQAGEAPAARPGGG